MGPEKSILILLSHDVMRASFISERRYKSLWHFPSWTLSYFLSGSYQESSIVLLFYIYMYPVSEACGTMIGSIFYSKRKKFSKKKFNFDEKKNSIKHSLKGNNPGQKTFK